MIYMVTGGTGFIGGAVIRQLVEAGHAVRALVRTSESPQLSHERIVRCRGDITDPASVRAAMSGADAVFHVAGWYKIGVPDPVAARAVNVDGTRHVLEAAKDAGVKRVVYTSTLAVNSDTHGQIVDETYRFSGRHISVYDRTKAEAHDLARQYAEQGLLVVIVQPGLVYGPGDTSSVGTTLRRFLRRQLPPLPSGTAFSWGYIDDIARGHLLAMERGAAGQSYFLAGPAWTLVGAIALASRLTGIPAPRVTLSPAVVKAAARVAGLVEMVKTLPPEYTSEGLRVLAGTTYLGNSARAERELGWTARPLEVGLSETLRHEMRQMGMPI
jgi:nucleoside-diphosphate-sugar epimerase